MTIASEAYRNGERAMRLPVFCAFVMIAFGYALAHQTTPGTELTGHVRDYGDDKPIGGVQVEVIELLQGRENTLGTGITEKDGKYSVSKLPTTGKVTVRFTKGAYKPRPKVKVLTLPASTDMDVMLHRESPEDPQYVRKEAAKIKTAAELLPQPAKGYEAQAAYLQREVHLPPAHFAQIAQALREILPPESRKSAVGFEGYFNVNPETLREVQFAFTNAIEGKATVPVRAEFAEKGIRQDVCADIAAYAIHEKKSSGNEESINAFYDKLRGAWGNEWATQVRDKTNLKMKSDVTPR
jgi:5-hydroxyisourate hydrolase-like protein (transthyretin family)